MKTSTLLTLLLLPICFACKNLWYPALYWHRDECRFRTLRESTDNNGTKEVFLKAIYCPFGTPGFGLNIICPTVYMNTWMPENPDPHSYVENLWQVDKDGYDKCEVNTKGDPKVNRLLLTCTNEKQIKYHPFVFERSWGLGIKDYQPYFEPGKHYYFISTSNGNYREITTRKKSGKNGSCEKYHMKLHIYVCHVDKEDCVYELPKCGPPPALYKEMRLIDGLLPPPTKGTALKPEIRTPRKAKPQNDGQITEPTTQSVNTNGEKMPICKEEKKGTSVQLILNFVLGGVALFMAVVIIILVCGLSNKSKGYEVERPNSAISAAHMGNYMNAEIVRYNDGHLQLSPVVVSRTPPTSPNIIIPPYATLQRVHSQRHNTPTSENYSVPLEGTSPEHSPLEDTPPEQSPQEILSHEARAFPFPDQPDVGESESNSDGVESSESGPLTTAIVTNPRHDHELNT